MGRMGWEEGCRWSIEESRGGGRDGLTQAVQRGPRSVPPVHPVSSESVPIRLIRVIRVLIVLVLGVMVVRPAGALHQRMYPLQELIQDADAIAVGRAVAVDVPKMRAALVIDEEIKGKTPYRWMALNVAPGGWGHPPAMIRRLGPGLPIVFFTAKVKGRHVVLGYANGTWFQITAPDGKEAGKEPDQLPWTFTHCEVFLRRTFAGKTEELEQLLRDVVAGKREAPAPNPGAGQGMGPEFPRDFQPAKPLPTLPEHIARAIAEPKAGGIVRKIAVRKLTEAEQKWVDQAAGAFQRPAEETAMLLAQASYSLRDAQRALEYERDYGRGGNRAWMRSAEEILDLKQRSDRLSWLDVRGVLMRAGELFTPVTDPVDLIHGLRTKFTWDELDPMFDDDKWGRKKLNEEIPKKLAARMQHPLGAGDRLRTVFYNLEFGAHGSGELPMETCGWKPLPGRNWDFPRRQYDWDGGVTGSQRPGFQFHPLGSLGIVFSKPPPPGIPFAGVKAGNYPGAALWFATGVGDYERRGRGAQGSYAYYDQTWLRVRQGDSRTFLLVAQVYTPDQGDSVQEPRNGWFYIRRPSRYIDAGIRLVDAQTRTVSLAPEQALLLPVEPVLDRFDRVLLRIDITTHKEAGKRNTEGKNEVRLIAYADGIGEVARTTLDLNRARRGGDPALDTSDEGVMFAPAFGLRRPDAGYVPEFYLGSVRVQQINDGAVDRIESSEPPGGLAANGREWTRIGTKYGTADGRR
jgi:hypothetical protein